LFDIELDVPHDELERTSAENRILNSSVPWFQDWIQNDRRTSGGRSGFHDALFSVGFQMSGVEDAGI